MHRRRLTRSCDAPITDLARHPSLEVTVAVLAAFKECDERTVVRMIAAGTLDAYKVGREWRIPTNAARAAFHVERHVQTTADISGQDRLCLFSKSCPQNR